MLQECLWDSVSLCRLRPFIRHGKQSETPFHLFCSTLHTIGVQCGFCFEHNRTAHDTQHDFKAYAREEDTPEQRDMTVTSDPPPYTMYNGPVDGPFGIPQAVCGSCQQSVGEKRYECGECESGYSLCESCYKAGRKSHVPGENHVFFEISAATRLAIHVISDIERSNPKRLQSLHFANCDICKNLISGPIRHKCLVCPDFDMCANCLENYRDRHDLSHPFIGFGVSKDWIVRCMAFTESVGGVPTVSSHTPSSSQRNISALHPATCNLCLQSIVGSRYKCFACPGKWFIFVRTDRPPHDVQFQIMIHARIASRKTTCITFFAAR